MAHVLKKPIFPCVPLIVSILSLAFAASFSPRNLSLLSAKISAVMDIFLELTFLDVSVVCSLGPATCPSPPPRTPGATASTLPQLSGRLRLQEPHEG